jgi:hypothetical protein
MRRYIGEASPNKITASFVEWKTTRVWKAVEKSRTACGKNVENPKNKKVVHKIKKLSTGYPQVFHRRKICLQKAKAGK